MVDEYFKPRISRDTEPFWQGCREHRLTAQRCVDCGTVRWPAAYLCPQCLGEGWETVDLGNSGTIYSYVVFHKPFDKALGDKVPYVVATVDFAQGVRLVSNIVDCNPAQIRCGARVRLVWWDGEEYSRPTFALEESKG